jgi:hypothetical protein
VAENYRATQRAKRPLEEKINTLEGGAKKLRSALLDVVAAKSLEEAQKIARKALL